jgi:uncharacterized protein YbaP (TraB family)
MNVRKDRLAALLIGILMTVSMLGGCVTKQAADAPALWAVTAPGGQTTYLFGTFHLGTEDLYPLPDVIMDAFDNSDYLAVEVNVQNTQEMDLASLDINSLMYTDGRTVADDIGEDLYNRLSDVLIDLTGLDESEIKVFDYFKPFVLAAQIEVLMLTKSGMQSNMGTDMFFLTEAEKRGMEILETESVALQMDLLSGFSLPVQIKYLEMDLDSAEEMRNYIDADDFPQYAAWRQGDLSLLEEGLILMPEAFGAAELAKEFNDAMITNRNIGMADKAEEYMADGKSVFFAVGAAHMIGDGGIVDLLTERGYDVMRIN